MHQRATIETVMSYVEIGKNEGAKLLTGEIVWTAARTPRAGSTRRRYLAIARRECA